MKRLGDLLLKRKKLNKISLLDKDIFFVFRKVIKEEFGNMGAEKFIPDYYKDNQIFVKTKSSAWANELFSNRNKIIRKINAELGEKIIKEIKLK